MSSLEDIDIDLEEEAAKVLEEQEHGEGFDLSEAEPPEVDLEEHLDTILEDDWESEEPEVMDFGKETPEPPISPEISQDIPKGEEEQEEIDSSFDITPETVEEERQEEVPSIEPEIDERELLGLTLRLNDAQMEDFEGMISNARTLQDYLNNLGEHQSEIKEKIYQKLRDEYVSRKTDIFSTPEFTGILSDVKQDLQEMLTKKQEFVSTVERLNEELEEITVRHMVGEFDDTTLSEKEKAQISEIELWNDKTERIERFITRYQHSLDAEQELNPIPTAPEPSEGIVEKPETEEETAVESEEGFVSEQETASSSEQEEILPFGQELLSSLEEEELSEEQEEDISYDIPDTGEETIETGESSTDVLDESDDFSLDTELETEADFDLDNLVKAASEELTQEESEEESYDIFEEEEESKEEEMISCKKCGRPTPASEKFCIHCGAKAR
jgi:hypothetical protein